LKFIILIAVFYIFYRIYKIGLINGAKNELDIRRNDANKSANTRSANQKDYTDYEEIK